MTDLEEEVLFQLSRQERELSVIALAERLSQGMKSLILLATLYQTLFQLEERALIGVSYVNAKKRYRITNQGVAALQRDWKFYREHVNEYARG